MNRTDAGRTALTKLLVVPALAAALALGGVQPAPAAAKAPAKAAAKAAKAAAKHDKRHSPTSVRTRKLR